jgi:hypothetical protein
LNAKSSSLLSSAIYLNDAIEEAFQAVVYDRAAPSL